MVELKKGRNKRLELQSFNNPMDVDDYMQTIGSKSQNLGLEERIQKLEKLLGLKTDEYRDAGKNQRQEIQWLVI
ncbi:hypothetical protein CFP56_020214 [Quercus suber]|uniref:Uncharacterized protein n=1 Tax=Quercus suber TaxID=58331 RepID=A0AAW0KFI6_QUESU